MRSILLDSVDSTNDYLKRISTPQTELFLFARALEQISGKGRLGRQWLCEKNKSLITSVILPYSSNSFQLGFIGAFAAVDLILKEFNVQCFIKWPNDIYLNHKKLGGVLAEKNANTIILGIGLNLNQNQFSTELNKTAISLSQVYGKEINVNDFFQSFKNFFKIHYQNWQQNSSDFIKNRVSPLICWVSKKVKVDLIGQDFLEGILLGIDQQGFLMIQTNETIHKITTGDLKLWLQE